MDNYIKFTELNLETSIIGLDRRNLNNDDTGYFCTPVGANIIGWEGCDGIHYCFIDKFGEMVFAVNPMTCCDYYVYPLAENFTDFLRLLVTLRSTAALEQIILWDKQGFEAFMNRDNQKTFSSSPEVLFIVNTLQEHFHISPMEQPFEYVKKLQSNFKYSEIPFSSEYYQLIPG